MRKSPETNRLKPKLITSRKFFLLFIAIFFGPFLFIVGEYRAKGSVSGVTLCASVAAFVICLIILVVLGWYANKPEER